MKIPLPPLKNRLQELISLPSVSSVSPQWDMGNQAVIDLLASWFETLGFTVHIQQLRPGKANMIARKGSGSGGLILSGHTDTVPFNEESWQFNPLKLTESDDRFYGLGTADMKSFFALIIEAVTPLLDKTFEHPLIVLATADEESTMSGARALSSDMFGKARTVVIGEPTNLKPVHMHKSIMMQALKVQGKSGHSSDPGLGNNALDAMHDMITEIRHYRETLKERYQQSGFKVMHPTLNLGCIHGGDNPNRICHHCELHFDFRGLPGMKNDDIREQLLNRLQPIASRHQVEISFEELFGGVEAFEQDPDSELVKISKQLGGHEPEAVAFATEASYFKSMGMDTLIMGPGNIDQAHQPDEYLDLDQIKPSVKLLQGLINYYCLQ